MHRQVVWAEAKAIVRNVETLLPRVPDNHGERTVYVLDERKAPLLNPLRAVQAALAYPITIPVLFEGRSWISNELPPHYLIKYLLITTPPGALVLLAVGLAAAARSALRDPFGPRSLPLLLVAFWLAVPLALPLVRRPNLYDGLRHVLFVLPALALLAGVGAAALMRAAGDRYRVAAAAMLLFVCVFPARSLVRLHPYQMTYFNAFVGGVRGAQERYETDYWVSSYKEAVEWINQQAARAERELNILVAINDLSAACAEWYLDDRVRASATGPEHHPGAIPADIDYYVATTRYGLDRSFPESPIVHTIGREGAVFTVIRGR